jgi:hypothetical protein
MGILNSSFTICILGFFISMYMYLYREHITDLHDLGKFCNWNIIVIVIDLTNKLGIDMQYPKKGAD